MPRKSTSKRPVAPDLLSPALQQAFAHFLKCHSPKFFSRNLRNMLVEVMTRQQGNQPLYLNSLLLAMEMFFDVLDTAEDEAIHNDDELS